MPIGLEDLSREKIDQCAVLIPVADHPAARENLKNVKKGNAVTDHRNSILYWARQGRLAAENVEQAMREAGELPGRSDWRGFIDRLLLWGGAVLLAVGVIFFFAYNWSELSRVARLGLAELLLAVAVACCGWFSTESPAGKASLFTAAVLTGALLALFGQTYQTGADTFELFITWAVLILPWTIVGRLPALWVLLIVLVNTAITLYFMVFPGLFGLLFSTEKQLWLLFAFNTTALVLWERFSRSAEWLRERWAARLLGFASGSLITTLMLFAIFDHNEEFVLAAVIAYHLWLAAIYVCYRRFILDLFFLAGGVLSIVIVVASLLSKVMEHAGSERRGFSVHRTRCNRSFRPRRNVAQKTRTGGFTMNSLSTEQLWDRLAEENLVTGERAPTPDRHSPWFVRVMLGFAGWIGALFMLGFVGASLSFIIKSSTASLIAGATYLRRRRGHIPRFARKKLCSPVRTCNELRRTGPVHLRTHGNVQMGERL